MSKRKEHWLKKTLRYVMSGAPILAFPGFVTASLDAAWAGKMGWAAIWLCVGWVVATVGTYVAEPLVDAKTRHRLLATFLVGVFALIAALGTRYGETLSERGAPPRPISPPPSTPIITAPPPEEPRTPQIHKPRSIRHMSSGGILEKLPPPPTGNCVISGGINNGTQVQNCPN
jgi:hypothetical protein